MFLPQECWSRCPIGKSGKVVRSNKDRPGSNLEARERERRKHMREKERGKVMGLRREKKAEGGKEGRQLFRVDSGGPVLNAREGIERRTWLCVLQLRFPNLIDV